MIAVVSVPVVSAPAMRTPTAPRRHRNRHHRWGKGAVRWMEGDPCFFCGYAGDTWDHLDPIVRGGAHTDNVARACGACNTHKAGTPLIVWLAKCRAGGRFRAIVANGVPPLSPEQRHRRRVARRQRRAAGQTAVRVAAGLVDAPGPAENAGSFGTETGERV